MSEYLIFFIIFVTPFIDNRRIIQNDDFILDNSPIVDKWGNKYDKKYQIFTHV